MAEHLYFHIPFCPKLCPYCSFYVETGSQNKTRRFLDALLREVEQTATQLRPRTIYFGGGTPSALTEEQLAYLFAELPRRVDFSALEELTFEANPATIRAEKARVLRAGGVTRISLGVQSWDDALLQTLGRVHTAAQAEQTFHLLRAAGFDNINLDLMFAIPGQSLAQWKATLACTIALGPEHISSYCLTYEEDTAYFRQLQLGTFRQDEERDAELFELTMDTLAAAGYVQYEISNYARLGRESAHNQAYWRGADYLGFGPSAFSTTGLKRWQNIADTTEYLRRVKAGEVLASFREELSPATRRGEMLAFAMRTTQGVERTALAGYDAEIREFHELGFLAEHADRLVLTRRGKLMADAVGRAFV